MKTPPQNVTRRSFIRNTTMASVAAATPYIVPASALGRSGAVPANDRLQIGLIGCGGMGRGNLANCAKYPDVQVTAVCDVWKARRDATAAQYAGSKPYHHFGEMLHSVELDGVIIATPPHWHFLIAVAACEAGKDIYLQKPMTRYPAEALALRAAVRQHQRISQIGTQIHATENYRRVVEWIRSGRLGKISVVRTFNVMNQGPNGIGNPPPSKPPRGLDWNLWVGPAKQYPYNPLVVRSAYENCSFMEFSGGWTPGMAPHIIDLPFWALDLGVPLRTTCSGGRFVIHDIGDAPDSQEILWEYPNMTMAWSMNLANSFGFDFGRGTRARRLGIYFQGLNATLYANYSMHQIVPEGDFLQDTTPPEKSIPPSPGQEREWLDCIKSRKQPSCNVDYHYKLDLAISLANLSMQVHRTIQFDSSTEKIVGDPEAARLAKPEYRAPWTFPNKYLKSALH